MVDIHLQRMLRWKKKQTMSIARLLESSKFFSEFLTVGNSNQNTYDIVLSMRATNNRDQFGAALLSLGRLKLDPNQVASHPIITEPSIARL